MARPTISDSSSADKSQSQNQRTSDSGLTIAHVFPDATVGRQAAQPNQIFNNAGFDASHGVGNAGVNPSDLSKSAGDITFRPSVGNSVFIDSNSDPDAPTSKVGRVATASFEALNPINLASGVGNAVVSDYEHPLQLAKTVGESALIGAALKTVLPDGGPTGLIAGAAIGGYFLYQSLKPMGQAVSDAANSTKMSGIHNAAKEMDDTVGSFAVNSAVGMAGYKIGAGAADYVLKSQSMDGFADAKADFWNGIDNTLRRAANAQTMTADGLPSPFDIKGNKATMVWSERSEPDGKLVSSVDPNAPVDISVYLDSKASHTTIERTLDRIATGRQAPLDDAAFNKEFGVDPAGVTQITDFAAKNGLKISDLDTSSGRVVLTGSASEMGSAFDTALGNYQAADGTIFRGRVGAISLPTSLSDHVSAVLGLDQRVQAHNYVEVGPAVGDGGVASVNGSGDSANPASTTHYMPQQVGKMYNFPMDKGGAGSSVGIVELGGGLDLNDNAAYYAAHGLPKPNINVIQLDGALNTTGDTNADAEVALDSQVIGTVAPKATQNLIFTNNSDQGFVDGITRASFQPAGETPDSAISVSWGAPESSWTQQGATALRTAIQKAALKGVNVFVASGDHGAVDNSSNGSFQVDLPASIPEAIATGGTKLIGDGNTISSETAWNEGKDGSGTLWSGGGGISQIFGKPDYQDGVNLPANANGTNVPGRGVPDVAGNAALGTGYTVRVGGTEHTIGGTSAVAPLYTALNALLQTENGGKSVGWLNPTLYQLGAANSGGVFNDITQGNNNGYKAGTGWDAVTGWGSINGGNLLKAIQATNTKANKG